jgi:lipopolysaccharide export system protein LptA
MTPTKAILTVLIVGLCATAAPAMAQAVLDPNAPLDISAPEQSEYRTDTCTLELKGNVSITQDRVRLLAGTITTSQAKRAGNCGAWTRLEAVRDVYYVTPNEKVRADRAVYDVSGKTVTFTGGVIVVRGQDVAATDKLVINLRTNDFTMTGAVRSIIYPDRTAQ